MTAALLATTDPDALALGTETELAAELDRAMARSPHARAAYLATWGVEWAPLTSADVQTLDHARAARSLLGTRR